MLRNVGKIIANCNSVAGGCFSIKTQSYQYMKCHCGDKIVLYKMVMRPSYLQNGIFYTDNMAYQTNMIYQYITCAKTYIGIEYAVGARGVDIG